MVSHTLSVHKEHEFLLRLETAGLSDELAQKVIDSKEQARAIMGSNFFGIEEAIERFEVNPSKRQLTALAEVPWSEEVLQSHKDTHVLVAVFPMSMLDIRGKVEHTLFYSHDDAWYNRKAFMKDRGKVGWQLVRKTPIAGSTSKTWSEQQDLLLQDEKTPSAQVMVYTIIGQHLATSERLFENLCVRTSSVSSDGDRVYVGQSGLNVNNWWDDYRYGYIGVSSARKPA